MGRQRIESMGKEFLKGKVCRIPQMTGHSQEVSHSQFFQDKPQIGQKGHLMTAWKLVIEMREGRRAFVCLREHPQTSLQEYRCPEIFRGITQDTLWNFNSGIYTPIARFHLGASEGREGKGGTDASKSFLNIAVTTPAFNKVNFTPHSSRYPSCAVS